MDCFLEESLLSPTSSSKKGKKSERGRTCIYDTKADFMVKRTKFICLILEINILLMSINCFYLLRLVIEKSLMQGGRSLNDIH